MRFMIMPRFIGSLISSMALLALAFSPTVAAAQELGPDALVRAVSRDVIAAIKQDRDMGAGNPQKIVELVEKMILPHVDTVRMARLAVGAGWRQATPEQQQRLAQEFTTLLVHTYSGALASYADQVLDIKPVRAQAGDGEVTVRSEVRQPGTQPLAIEYSMAKTPSGWKLHDIKIGGLSLVSTYRSTFSEEVRNRGIEGLIGLLSNKNRQNGRRIAPAQT
jgi:phospholipid transport system substrate-binding protein